MATKKYIMKSEVVRFADGTTNEEHIQDIISQMEIAFGNIQDNNDICMQLYKVKQLEGTDEDTVDAIQLACEESIQIEKSAREIMQVVDKAKENISKYGRENEQDFENLLSQIKSFEEKSKSIMERVI